MKIQQLIATAEVEITAVLEDAHREHPDVHYANIGYIEDVRKALKDQLAELSKFIETPLEARYGVNLNADGSPNFLVEIVAAESRR